MAKRLAAESEIIGVAPLQHDVEDVARAGDRWNLATRFVCWISQQVEANMSRHGADAKASVN